MEKFDWVLQPPQADKTTFLVDEIGQYGTYGRTTDLDKLNYNRQLLGVNFNLDIGIKTALATKGVTAIITLGRFITVLQMRKDEMAGSMTFGDYAIALPTPELRNVLLREFSADVTEQWLLTQSRLRSGFSSSADTVGLLKV